DRARPDVEPEALRTLLAHAKEWKFQHRFTGPRSIGSCAHHPKDLARRYGFLSTISGVLIRRRHHRSASGDRRQLAGGKSEGRTVLLDGESSTLVVLSFSTVRGTSHSVTPFASPTNR